MQATMSPAIRWSVKRSFLDYVEGMADGVVDVAGGATRSGATVRFPIVAASAADALVAAAGSVRCTGHHGMLAIAFEAPRIELADGRLAITIVDDDEPDGRLALADLGDWRVAAGVLVAERPTLTSDGADLFFGNYRAGIALEPLEADLDATAAARASLLLEGAHA